LFIDAKEAKRHLRIEWEKLSLLYRLELNAPHPLFYGLVESENEQWALVMEKITDAQSAYQRWRALTTGSQKLEFMRLVFSSLAQHHSKGVMQDDLQLDNFLYKDNTLYALDAYQMRFYKKALNKKRSLEQLALVSCQCQELEEAQWQTLCQDYAALRGIQFSCQDYAFFLSRIEDYTKMRLHRQKKKVLRANKRHELFKTETIFSILDRRLVNDEALSHFINPIDKLMDSGQILKNGNTCFLSRFTWNNLDIVVKRYNRHGFIRSMLGVLRISRARRCWFNANALGLLNIPTAEPLGFIEKSAHGIAHTSYFICRYLPAATMKDYLLDKRVEEDKKKLIVKKVSILFQRLKKFKITHGDMKHLNFLVTEDNPALIDLDSMRFHRWNGLFIKKWRNDIFRFSENWKQTPELYRFFSNRIFEAC
jgi:tRNA A-37 threonylcarbamoyl transferase component Bud32